jgi:hypothetical protein
VKAKDINSGKETIIYDAKEVFSELKIAVVEDLQVPSQLLLIYHLTIYFFLCFILKDCKQWFFIGPTKILI